MRQDRRWAEDVHVARRDVQSMNHLALVLPISLLVKLIRRLETISRQKQVQVKGIFGVGAVINAIEEIHRGAAIVQDGELRRIEKAT